MNPKAFCFSSKHSTDFHEGDNGSLVTLTMTDDGHLLIKAPAHIRFEVVGLDLSKPFKTMWIDRPNRQAHPEGS